MWTFTARWTLSVSNRGTFTRCGYGRSGQKCIWSMVNKILVCVKPVPAVAEVELDGQFRLKRDGTQLQLNIADLSAVEAALKRKDQQPGTEVTVLTMGPEKAEPVLKELFSLGVDRVVLLCDRALAGADSLATARTLSAAVRHLGEFDCIFCGRRAMDAETGQIPAQLAAALDIPVVTNVQELTVQENAALCIRRLEDSQILVRADLPCVVSFCEYVHTLRLPSISARRRARDKQVEHLTAADIGLPSDGCGMSGSRTRVVHVDTKAPGLRKCVKNDLQAICAAIREVAT